MSILGSFILPHPPIMLAQVGGAETAKVEKTISAVRQISQNIAAMKPETVIIISPHGPLFSDAITISAEPRLVGNMKKFNAPQVKIDIENDLELVERIALLANSEGIHCFPITEESKIKYGFEQGVDHGTMVPLYFINNEMKDFKIVNITYSFFPNETHYRFGTVIRQAIEQIDRKTVIIASGDLSHRLSNDAPSGYDKRGAEFDNIFTQQIAEGTIEKLIELPHSFVEGAGVCALRSTIILFGCLDGCKTTGKVYSYEGPFGVGYCTAQIFAENCIEKSDILEKLFKNKRKKINEIRTKEDPYVKLARTTLENYVRGNDDDDISKNVIPEMLNEKAGTFVSIKKAGQLRGCIGTIKATQDSIALEIVFNAISAGQRDPRFSPVTQNELDDLVYSVDILKEPQPIESKEELDVYKYGVIVRKGGRSGLLLPNLEGIDNVDEQIKIALNKAGISPQEDYKMERFEVIRHY